MSTAQERRFHILRAIVQDYIAFQEPVGSQSLVEKYQLGISSATVRNDMAVLEAEGYITHKHTSSGRVPTNRGYRQFVDQLDEIKPFSKAERTAILRFLEQGVDLDDVLQRSVQLLSQLTNQVAIVQYPVLSSAKVRHLEVVDIAEHRLLLVLITDTGRVDQRIVELSRKISPENFYAVRDALYQAMHNKPLSQATAALGHLAENVDSEIKEPIVRASTILVDTLLERQEQRLVMGGTSNLTRRIVDNHFSTHAVRSILEALEEHVILLKILTSSYPWDISIKIGEETDEEHLKDASVVSTGYGSSGTLFGSLGVLGPTQMDYHSAIGSVMAVARYVGEVLSDR